ncbi:AEC family transporter [Desulfobulbus rhabdoformis]|uniref:AEC family transporter n=1 Tax=Desulfobulbus rhabdoformis TaxID=34032 RepID=UPI0019648D5E|nr:AEC family transporter [Desulfobulbus rhabdoformis]MBM9614536.1 AEC family transporter [Desulfobulbus rhabdoformis]
MILLDALFPVLALIVFGWCVRRFGLTDAAFHRVSDKLVYYVFFPLMLFWKIGGAPLALTESWRYLPAAVLAVSIVCALSLAYIHFRPVTDFQAGSFNQGCYRFNTYIGMAVLINTFGQTGVQLYGILIGLLIPLINVFCVSILIWFGGAPATGNRLVTTLKHLLANPLILACLAGISYSFLRGGFPSPVDNTLRLMSQVTLPLALFSIGGSLSFAGLKNNFNLALVTALFKLVCLPLVGLGLLWLFGVTGLAFKVSMLFFALPTSTAIYILSSQLNSDTELASAIIVLSTLLSFVSMACVLLAVA